MPTGSYTPIFEIYKGGENITANFQNRATEIKVELASGNGSQDTCSITLDDRDWLVATPHVGDSLSVYLGYTEVGMAFLGTFEIDEVTFAYLPKRITVHGNSEGLNSPIKSPTVKNFDGKTVKEILEAYGKDLGLEVVVDQDIGSKMIPYKNATASPMHVIGQMERQFNGVAKISNGRLSFAGRDSGLTALGQEIPLVVLRKEHIADCEVRHTTRGDYTKAVAQYKDADTNKLMFVESNSAVKGVLGQDEAGGNKPFTLSFTYPNKDEAQAAADSHMKALDRSLGEGLFTLAQGDPWIRDQNKILVTGTRDGIDGSYVADLVAHAYTKGGALTTSIRTTPSGDGADYSGSFAADPSAALAPEAGQVVGDVLPKGAFTDPSIKAGPR